MPLDVNSLNTGQVGFQLPPAAEQSPMIDNPSVLRFTHPLPYGAIIHKGGVQFVVPVQPAARPGNRSHPGEQ